MEIRKSELITKISVKKFYFWLFTTDLLIKTRESNIALK